MRRIKQAAFLATSMALLSGCAAKQQPDQLMGGNEVNINATNGEYKALYTVSLTRGEQLWRESLVKQYGIQPPTKWGENIPGVMTRMNTQEKSIALTLDACGGPNGSAYDAKMIDYLIKEKIPATLFINARWIDANPEIFRALSRNPLFEIENHGFVHRPLSINGKSAWGIKGTENAAQAVDEVLMNTRKIQNLTGRRPIYFRSGTAYYDDVTVRLVKDIGLLPVNYNVLGDAGGYFNKQQIYNQLVTAKPGSIILMHMNLPDKDSAEGLISAVPVLKKQGFRFVKLATYPLK